MHDGMKDEDPKNCLSPRIQALREIKLHRRQNIFHYNFYLKVDKSKKSDVNKTVNLNVKRLT